MSKSADQDDSRTQKVTLGWITETCADARTTITRADYMRMSGAVNGERQSAIESIRDPDEDPEQITSV